MKKRRVKSNFTSLIKKLTKAAKERKSENQSIIQKYSENASYQFDERISELISKKIITQ